MHIIRFLVLTVVLGFSSMATAQNLTLLRDPDIEYALKKLAEPVLQAAGLSPSRVDILVINDRRLNAFVIDQRHIFIHSGLLLKMKTPAMLQSVIAHEAAHISNGHLANRRFAARNAQVAAQIGAALAVAAAVAAGAPEAIGPAATGVATGAQRRFFGHTRAEESAADQSGLRYMARAGIDTKGAQQVMEIFRGQEALSAARQDPYARTHPLSSDRLRVIRRLSDAYADKARPQPDADYWFARAKGKLSAFQRSPKWTLNRVGEYGFEDVKMMRQAVAWHRSSDFSKADSAMRRALAQRPNDPYLLELHGQILMENRKFSLATKAYGRAASLAPDNALILGSYGRALLANGQTAKARDTLERARARDGRDSRILRDLASAYAKQGNRGMASLLTAERYALIGRLKDANLHAERASKALPRGSGAWQRAQDVLSAVKAAASKKRR